MLAAGDLGHHAAKAGVEVNLSGHHARADHTVGVRHGHCGLVAGGLDGEHHRAGGGERLAAGLAALARHDGPGADGRARLRTLPHQLSVNGKRQPHAQDERVVAGAVVARAAALLRKAQAVVEAAGRRVLLVNLKRAGGGAQHLGVIGHARNQSARNALAAAGGVADDLLDLKVRTGQVAAGKADDATLVVGHPPAAAGLGELLVEDLLRPGVVGAALVGRGL